MFITLLCFINCFTYLYCISCGQQVYVGDGKFDFSSKGLTECEYQFKADYFPFGNSVMKLDWKKFNVPGKMPDCDAKDHVSVYLGCTKPAFLTRFCSSNMDGLPHNIYALDGCVTLKVLVSQDSKSSFSLRYTAMSRSISDFSSKCHSDRSLRSSSDVIASPNWPMPYTPSMFPYGKECNWNIKASSSRKLIRMNIMDVDIYTSGYYCTSYENLEIIGKKSILTNTKTKNRYCRVNQLSLNPQYYEMEVEMEISRSSRYSYSNRGFILGYVIYTDEEASAKTNKWYIIAGIGGGIFLLLIISCCCCCFFAKRSKRSRIVVKPTSYGTATQLQTPTAPSKPSPSNYSDQYSGVAPLYPPQQSYPFQQDHPQQPLYNPAYLQQQGYPSASNDGYPPHQTFLGPGYSDQPPPPYPGTNNQQPLYPQAPQLQG